MANRRSISWGGAMRDMRADRATRPDIREERLRNALPDGTPLSAWRGRSGKRHVVTVHPLAVPAAAPPAVLVAVRRGSGGTAEIVAVEADIDPGRVGAWIEAAAASGAGELHLHTLVPGAAERKGVADDLASPPEGST